MYDGGKRFWTDWEREDTIRFYSIRSKHCDTPRGVCRISQGGGAQLKNFWDFGYTCRFAAKLRSFARGVWGHAPSRNFF